MCSKKGVSEFVAYVFLIIITIIIATIVYSFLRGYVLKPAVECQTDASLKTIGYECQAGKLIINLRNDGLFDVDGFLLKVSNTTRKPALDLGEAGGNFFTPILRPGEDYSANFTNSYGNLTRLEVIPLKIIDKQIVICQKARITLNLENCTG